MIWYDILIPDFRHWMIIAFQHFCKSVKRLFNITWYVQNEWTWVLILSHLWSTMLTKKKYTSKCVLIGLNNLVYNIMSISLYLSPSGWCHWAAKASNEGYLPSGLDFITVVWSDLGRCLPPVSGWPRMFVSSVCVCVCLCVLINALILLTVPLAQIEQAWLTD